MTVSFEPSVLRGRAVAPPSKSIAHRALICGALTESARIGNLAPSQDILATLDCLSAMGASADFDGNTATVGGLDPFSIPSGSVLNCRESGSTLRFLIPFCLLSGNEIILTGSERLFQRPLGVYESICAENGFEFERGKNRLTLCGKLKNGIYTLPGNISSQFVTGLLLSLPLIDGESVINISGTLESRSYVDITLGVMNDFGVTVAEENGGFVIPGGQEYNPDGDYTVEGDFSNTAFLDCFNLAEGEVSVLGLPEAGYSRQGDRVYKKMFSDLRAGVKKFDLTDCPDLGPVMFALSALYGGAEFTGTARLRIKESDRVACMASELKKFGAELYAGDNSAKIVCDKLKKPEMPLYGHNDHRIVMALSLLCTVTGGSIEGAEAVAKSFPDYFKVIKNLNAKITETE